MAIRPYILTIHHMHCSNCGQKVSKTLSVRINSCPKCQTVLDRDENAAINILNKALNEVGIILSACGGYEINQPVFAQRCASTRKKLLCLRNSRYNRSYLTGENFTL
ncbi:zinc ribbon domain-containing protein [Okeania sp. SIO2C9]|uniref:zinc ribbon domain-containing protein n=1 Tax=Okeania sp. SIO2C9 TaxID=2607791 RepID=UPI0025D083DB|nr:zinc ribbon domain-containing protein [Okeania sp. SIO2C9]